MGFTKQPQAGADPVKTQFFHFLVLIPVKWHIGAAFTCSVKHSGQLFLGSKPPDGSKWQGGIL